MKVNEGIDHSSKKNFMLSPNQTRYYEIDVYDIHLKLAKGNRSDQCLVKMN